MERLHKPGTTCPSWQVSILLDADYWSLPRLLGVLCLPHPFTNGILHSEYIRVCLGLLEPFADVIRLGVTCYQIASMQMGLSLILADVIRYDSAISIWSDVA